MSTGRYGVIDLPSGRRFMIEPIAERDQKIDGQVFTNGGLSGNAVKNAQRGGAIRAEDSEITADQYKNIVILPPGVSPNSFVDALLKCTTVEQEEALLGPYRVRE
jgi:hypothetical protein